jgi:hypothetical protein
LYGSRVAETEVTFITRVPDLAEVREVPEADMGVETQLARNAETINIAVKTIPGRAIRMIVSFRVGDI